VVRERSAKPLYVGSIPTRASNKSPIKLHISIDIRRNCTAMAKIKNEDLIWVRPDIKFDGDYVLAGILAETEFA
jgi:hypothetical protein